MIIATPLSALKIAGINSVLTGVSQRQQSSVTAFVRCLLAETNN